jgi:hypothetical protein
MKIKEKRKPASWRVKEGNGNNDNQPANESAIKLKEKAKKMAKKIISVSKMKDEKA